MGIKIFTVLCKLSFEDNYGEPVEETGWLDEIDHVFLGLVPNLVCRHLALQPLKFKKIALRRPNSFQSVDLIVGNQPGFILNKGSTKIFSFWELRQ